MREYKIGDKITFKNLTEYEVIFASTSGYLVAGNLKQFGSDEVRFFRLDYLLESERRNLLARDVNSSSTGPSQASEPNEELQESHHNPVRRGRGRPKLQRS